MTKAITQIRLAIVPALAGCLAFVVALPAAAEETFVCDDGRVLTLTQEQVSELVKTDPCIAKYFGREISASPVSEPPAAVLVNMPLPERKPEAVASALRELKDDPTAPAAAREPVAIADVPSDFRNVHIINAGKGAPAYYKHTR